MNIYAADAELLILNIHNLIEFLYISTRYEYWYTYLDIYVRMMMMGMMQYDAFAQRMRGTVRTT